jgi:hypothetical protein
VADGAVPLLLGDSGRSSNQTDFAHKNRSKRATESVAR